MEAAAQRANSVGLRRSVVQVHPVAAQVPSRRPMAWQVPWQTERPMSQRLGSRVRKSSREIFSSEHLKKNKPSPFFIFYCGFSFSMSMSTIFFVTLLFVFIVWKTFLGFLFFLNTLYEGVMKTSAWRRPPTSRKPQSGRRDVQKTLVWSTCSLDQTEVFYWSTLTMKTSVWSTSTSGKPQSGWRPFFTDVFITPLHETR